MNGQFYLFGQRESATYKKATAAHRMYGGMKMPPLYDKKITYRIFFACDGRPDQFGISGTESEFRRAFIPKTMEEHFPQNLNCHPRKPFGITASYHCMTFVFHIAGSVAITRNYWRSQNPEIEIVKNLGKLMVTNDLKRKGVLSIIPRVDDSIQDYSAENMARCSAYNISQIAEFFRSDPHGQKLGEPISSGLMR
jgi:hypothetical protein